MATKYFKHESEWQIAVCRECRIAVWPAYATAHLHGRYHGLTVAEAQRVADELHAWPGLAEHASQIQLPEYVVRPVASLVLHADGV